MSLSYIDWVCFFSTFPKVSTFIEFLKAFEDTGGKKTGERNRQEEKEGSEWEGIFKSGFLELCLLPYF